MLRLHSNALHQTANHDISFLFLSKSSYRLLITRVCTLASHQPGCQRAHETRTSKHTEIFEAFALSLRRIKQFIMTSGVW